YLRDQGVSDRVVNIMLEQRRRVIEAGATMAPPQPGATQVPAPAEAPLTPVQAAPASSMYVIPYDSYPAYYPAYYPSYYPYYDYWPWWSPTIVIGGGFRGFHHGIHGFHG